MSALPLNISHSIFPTHWGLMVPHLLQPLQSDLLRAVQSAGRDLSLSITHLKQHLEAVADADLAGDSLLQSIEQQHAIRYCLGLINDLADASTTDSKVGGCTGILTSRVTSRGTAYLE
jgi:hypothetical protein